VTKIAIAPQQLSYTRVFCVSIQKQKEDPAQTEGFIILAVEGHEWSAGAGGVTIGWDGARARSKFGAPMFKPEVFWKRMYCIEESTCNIVGTFRRPENCAPLCPLVTPCRAHISVYPTPWVIFAVNVALVTSHWQNRAMKLSLTPILTEHEAGHRTDRKHRFSSLRRDPKTQPTSICGASPNGHRLVC